MYIRNDRFDWFGTTGGKSPLRLMDRKKRRRDGHPVRILGILEPDEACARYMPG